MSSDRRILFLLFLLLLTCGIVAIAQEQITLTTYYPAPFGEYEALRIVPSTDPSVVGQACTEFGLVQYDSSGQMVYCKQGTWEVFNSSTTGGGEYWTQPGGTQDLYPSDIAWRVGIGTTTPDPNSKMTIAGGLQLYDQPATNKKLYMGYNASLDYAYISPYDLTTSTYKNLVMTGSPTQGRVGIGTGSPSAKLDIAATGDGTEVLRLSTERPWTFRQVGSGSGAELQLRSTVNDKEFSLASQSGSKLARFYLSNTLGNSSVIFNVPTSVNSNFTVSGTVTFLNGAAQGAVLTSNAAGLGTWKTLPVIRGNASGYMNRSSCPNGGVGYRLLVTYCRYLHRCTDFGDWISCNPLGWAQGYVDAGCTVCGDGPSPADRTQPRPVGLCIPE